MRRYQLVVEEAQARDIETLAREYGLTEQAVIEQLVTVGLEQVQCESHDDATSGPQRLRE